MFAVLWLRAKKHGAPYGLRFEVVSATLAPDGADNSNAKKFVAYQLMLVQDTADEVDSNPPAINRRYSDFLQLFESLKADYPSLMTRQHVLFPKKCLIGNFSRELTAERAFAFEEVLGHILKVGELRDSPHFLRFLEDRELDRACRLLDERRPEAAIPLLENSLRLLNRIFTDRSRPVLLVLCRIVAACSHPVPLPVAEKWADLALRRYDGVCDSELLPLYVPLIKTCVYLYWHSGRDKTHLDAQLELMGKRGINVKKAETLAQAIHALDPRTESA